MFDSKGGLEGFVGPGSVVMTIGGTKNVLLLTVLVVLTLSFVRVVLEATVTKIVFERFSCCLH